MPRATMLILPLVLAACTSAALTPVSDILTATAHGERPAAVIAAATVTGAAPSVMVAGTLRDLTADVTGRDSPGEAVAGPARTSANPAALEREILREVNATRAMRGAGPLSSAPGLRHAAQRYSQELAGRRLIDHLSVTPGRETFRHRIAAEGVRARIAGENLARLTATERDLASRVVRAWMGSPGHRKNLLDPSFARTGIGVRLGNDGVWYVVHLLASTD